MQDLLGNTTFWYFLSFVVFVAIAYRLGGKAVTAQLDKQITDIKKKIETAEGLRVEAQEMLAQYQRKQRDALKEADSIIENAKKNAAKIKAQAEAELEATMERREKQIIERIDRMQQEAVSHVQEQAAELALKAARILIADHLDANQNNGLVEDTLRDISSQLRQ